MEQGKHQKFGGGSGAGGGREKTIGRWWWWENNSNVVVETVVVVFVLKGKSKKEGEAKKLNCGGGGEGGLGKVKNSVCYQKELVCLRTHQYMHDLLAKNQKWKKILGNESSRTEYLPRFHVKGELALITLTASINK